MIAVHVMDHFLSCGKNVELETNSEVLNLNRGQEDISKLSESIHNRFFSCH